MDDISKFPDIKSTGHRVLGGLCKCVPAKYVSALHNALFIYHGVLQEQISSLPADGAPNARSYLEERIKRVEEAADDLKTLDVCDGA